VADLKTGQTAKITHEGVKASAIEATSK